MVAAATQLPVSHPAQGVKAADSGFQIGGTTIMTGTGTPGGAVTALAVGDLYVDQTSGTLYQATAVGTGSWVLYTAATAVLSSNTTIGGSSIQTQAGTPLGVTTAARIGDIAIDYTNGMIYIAGATGTGGWINIGGGIGTANSGVDLTYSAVIPLATLQAGATILPAITGMSYTILGYKVFTASGTPAGTGNFIVSNAAGTQVILTASVAQLATASTPSACINDQAPTLSTIGAYTGVKLTQGVAVKFAAMASLTGPYTMQANIRYIVTV